MYNINFYGNYEADLVPEVIRYMLDYEYEKVEEMIKNGFNINEKVRLGRFGTEVSLLNIACVQNDEFMFNFLIENGYKVSGKYDDSVWLAGRFCRPYLFAKRLRYLKEICDDEAEDLIERICSHGEYFQNIFVLEKKGLKISEDGGYAFVSAAYAGNKKLVKFLLKNGVDINYHKQKICLWGAPTALIEAINKGHLKLAKYLVKKGADVTISDTYGNRAVDVAIKKGYIKFAKYLKKFEPEEYKLAREKEKSEFELPEELVAFLKKSDKERKISFSSDCCTKFMKFYSYDDMVWFDYKKNKVIDLVSCLDNYGVPSFVFNLKNSKVYGLDIEHGTFVALAKWDKFYANMEHYVNGFLKGDFDRKYFNRNY